MKTKIYIIFFISIYLIILYGCNPASTTPVDRTLQIEIVSSGNFINFCDAVMMDNENIETVQVQIYTVNSNNDAEPWDSEYAYQELTLNQYLESTVKVPSSGVYTMSVTVFGKCNTCCSAEGCSPEPTGRPVYSGVSNKINGGGNLPTVKVRFTKCICDCNN